MDKILVELAIVIIGFNMLGAVIVSCTLPKSTTHAEVLDRQVKKERMIRSCKNAGGIWYQTGRGRYGGHCDWTPRY